MHRECLSSVVTEGCGEKEEISVVYGVYSTLANVWDYR